jgi:hypothetical protein
MFWINPFTNSLHDSNNSGKIDYLAYPEREDKMSNEIPQLSDMERLELHDVMMSIAFESERVEKYKMMIDISNTNISMHHGKLNEWKSKFNEKLKAAGLDVSMVDINSDTGKVTVNNITQLSEKLNGAGKQHSSA